MMERMVEVGAVNDMKKKWRCSRSWVRRGLSEEGNTRKGLVRVQGTMQYRDRGR